MSHGNYEAAVRTAAAPSAGAAWVELRNGSTRPCYLKELSGTLVAATTSVIGLIRSTAQGVGGAATATGLALDTIGPASVGLTLAAAAFSTPPTFGTSYFRRYSISGAIGAGFHWSWPHGDELMVPVSASLVIVAITAGAASADWFASWNE